MTQPRRPARAGLAIAVSTVLPTVIALGILVVLAAVGVVSWSAPVAVAVALMVLTAYTWARSLRRTSS